MIIKSEYKPRLNERQWYAHSVGERYVLYGGAYGGGKGHPYGTTLLTPDGWRKIEDVKVGDYVVSPDGVVKVEGVYNRGERGCYGFTFNDGSYIEADSEHLWKLQTFRDRMHRRYGRWQILSTKEIIERWGNEPRRYNRFIIPKVAPIDFASQMLPLGGYQLGLLLGDGCFKTDSSVTFSTADVELLGSFEGQVNYAGGYDYRLPHMNAIIRQLGLHGKHSYEKFIPQQYLWNDVETRKSVLCGLLDTDGYIDNRGHIYFDSASEQLAKDVKFLVDSLGGRATLTSKDRTYNYKGKKLQGLRCYELYIRTSFCPFGLKRKADRFKIRRSDTYKIIRSIKPVGTKKTICLKVSGESGLYVAQDFIVTHNTAWGINEGIRLSVQYKGNRGFMGCRDGTDFKRNALDQLVKFLPSELYAAPYGVHHQSDQYFKLRNGSVIYYGGLGNEIEAMKKISNMPELGWFFIDQAEEITENQFLLLDGRLRLVLPGIKYKALLTANPDPGWLRARFIEQSLPDHRFIPALPRDNPFLPKDYEVKLKEIYSEEMVRRLLEGDWDIPGVDALIPYQYIRGAIDRDLPAWGAKIGGLDVAEFGKAKTVFIARQGHKVIDIQSWFHMDTEFSAGAVAELIRKHKLLCLNIDTIGKGGEVYVLLKNDYPVRSVNVAEQSSQPDRYFNKRAEYYGKISKRFEMGEMDIPDNAQLASQLASLRKGYQKSKLKIESKEEMRKRGLQSPDFADALMLAFIESDIQREIEVYRKGVRVA